MTTNNTQLSTLSDADRIFKIHQESHWKYGQRSIRDRKKDLKKLKAAVLKYRDRVAEAVDKDFSKSRFESDMSEIFPTVSAIRHALKHIDKWASIRPVSTPLSLIGTKAWIKPQPKGSTLIIAPWNFPFMLCLEPLIGALAAGNVAVLKPSEATPLTAQVIADMIAETFDEEQVAVLQGGPELSAHLCSLPFHHIFFTGGTEIGKKIMEAAAKNLTSVTLELGGKSPAIVDASAKLWDTASRIVQGRFLNGGQVCIAVDHVIVDASVHDKLVEHMKKQIRIQFPAERNDMSAMVHSDHYDRMKSLLNDAQEKGGVIYSHGTLDDSKRYFPPTLILNANHSMRVMQEEIFGPILPIFKVANEAEMLKTIQEQVDRPLSFYIFSSSNVSKKKYFQHSRAGSTGINDVIVQFQHPNLPFGGVNSSGIGKAHGEAGFNEFSNFRSVISQRWKGNASSLVRPPYTAFKQKVIDLMIRWF